MKLSNLANGAFLITLIIVAHNLPHGNAGWWWILGVFFVAAILSVAIQDWRAREDKRDAR